MMTEKSRDLLKSFGKLLHNRGFLMVVGHQAGMGGHGGPNGGRGQMQLAQLLYQTPDGLTNAEIAEILDIRPSSVSATITRLVDAELAERIPSATDKRVVIVRLTDRGREFFDQRDSHVDEMADKLFGGLTPEEQAQLEDLLTKLSHQVDDLQWDDFRRPGHGWPHRGMDRPHF